MSGENYSRRGVLKSAGVLGATTLLASGTGGANGKPPRRIVGTTGDAGSNAAAARAEAVTRRLDFGDIGQAVAGRFADAAVEALSRREDVRYVEEDIDVHAIGTLTPGNGNGNNGGDGGSTSQTLPWGIDRTDSEVAHANGETGAGADIAIIDTGIDDDHPDLEANIGSGRAFESAKGKNANYDWSDDDNHGTHCAGSAGAVNNGRGVVGVATEATLHAVKVLDKRGSGTLSNVAAGIQYTADQGWDVASMSLGAASGAQTLKDACTYAHDRGVLLVAAAGNDGPCTGCVGYPAAYSEVVGVGATTQSDTLADFSSTGGEVEIAAPGANIYSTVIGGYDTYSGTSMACPHVSGAGAQLMANGMSNTQARDRLVSTAEDIGLAANESGAGLLDTAAALGLDSSDD